MFDIGGYCECGNWRETPRRCFNCIGKRIADNAVNHGFSRPNKRNMPEKLMLVVTEVSEAMEAWRKSDYKNFNEEIADTIIRLLQICYCMKIDLEYEIEKKMVVNESRPFKHGNKKA